MHSEIAYLHISKGTNLLYYSINVIYRQTVTAVFYFWVKPYLKYMVLLFLNKCNGTIPLAKQKFMRAIIVDFTHTYIVFIL